MTVNYRLDAYEGPLDLLLQLVRRSQISVWEIRVKSIIDQFMEHMREQDSWDVETVTDFMVMAATLLRIKARLLLPRQREEEEEETSTQLSEEEEMLTRLLQYEGFKEVAEELERMAEVSAQFFPRGQQEELPPPKNEDPLAGVSLLTLAIMLQQALKKVEPAAEMSIEVESYSMAKQIAHLRSRLQDAGSGTSFMALLSTTPTRLEVVVTFLALLELVRLQEIRVVQDTVDAEVKIFRRNA